jgi:23S rRNA pseudouridine2605 synthase
VILPFRYNSNQKYKMEKRTPSDRKSGKKPYSREAGAGSGSSYGKKREGPRKPDDDRQDYSKDKDGYRKRDDNRKGREDYSRGDDNRKPGGYNKDGYKRRDNDQQDKERKPYRSDGFRKDSSSDRPYRKPFEKRGDKPYGDRSGQRPSWKNKGEKYSSYKPKPKPEIKFSSDGTIRLNKFIANSGVCSRREADVLIVAGAITVNGKVVSTLGAKVTKDDVVIYDGQRLTAERKVYVLLNKPKDFITTLDDPQGRKTVMELVKGAGDARIFPVGRLDRNTTGLLLLTNDGDLTKKLTHPKHGVKKLYHAHLDKPLTRADMATLSQGVEIEGEKVIPDAISYVGTGEDKTQVGIEIHSGQNRVVRRMFESLDYKVDRLDRVLFAGLSKREIPRGHWRFLTDQEVNFLKML